MEDLFGVNFLTLAEVKNLKSCFLTMFDFNKDYRACYRVEVQIVFSFSFRWNSRSFGFFNCSVNSRQL